MPADLICLSFFLEGLFSLGLKKKKNPVHSWFWPACHYCCRFLSNFSTYFSATKIFPGFLRLWVQMRSRLQFWLRFLRFILPTCSRKISWPHQSSQFFSVCAGVRAGVRSLHTYFCLGPHRMNVPSQWTQLDTLVIWVSRHGNQCEATEFTQRVHDRHMRPISQNTWNTAGPQESPIRLEKWNV